MGVFKGESVAVCRVLDEDPDLAEAIPAEQREQAIEECVARAVSVPTGRWPASRAALQGEGIGLLVLRGLLIRRVGVDGRFGTELLGAGDLLRPWPDEDTPTMLPVKAGWRVIEPVRMAALDDQFARHLARHPQLCGRLVARAVERSHSLAVNMAIVHHTRVDMRLHMLFWHLAARWGRVRSDGVSLPLRLTHSLLADLTAAQRPTVTSALAELARRGVVQATDDGWLLAGRPPGELLELRVLPRTMAVAGSAGAG